MVAKDKRLEGEMAVAEAIKVMSEHDRVIGEKLDVIIKENAPGLIPRTWYGFPAYGNENGKVVCFFRSSKKFGERYMTLGFNDLAMLDDGNLWPISYALKELTNEEEMRIADIVKKAVN